MLEAPHTRPASSQAGASTGGTGSSATGYEHRGGGGGGGGGGSDTRGDVGKRFGSVGEA